jgi:hypothetical protein
MPTPPTTSPRASGCCASRNARHSQRPATNSGRPTTAGRIRTQVPTWRCGSARHENDPPSACQALAGTCSGCATALTREPGRPTIDPAGAVRQPAAARAGVARLGQRARHGRRPVLHRSLLRRARRVDSRTGPRGSRPRYASAPEPMSGVEIVDIDPRNSSRRSSSTSPTPDRCPGARCAIVPQTPVRS